MRPLLVSPSGWLARQARAAWPDLAVAVAPNGVAWPGSPMAKTQARKGLGLSGEARVVLFLAHGGRQAGYKGGGSFMALWQGIKAAEPRALGLVVGGDRTACQGDLMEFPYLEGQALETVLRAADVLAYPSLADNHPLVVLEAMAHGLPVAAYGVGGVPEQVADGVSGLLADPGDEPGLTRAVLRILAEPRLARDLAGQALERAQRHFTARAMAQGYAKAYGRLGAAPGPG